MIRKVDKIANLEALFLYPQNCMNPERLPLIVWLHGFGADMYDLASLAEAVHRTGYVHCLPNAPLGGFGGPGGTVRAWYERGGKETPQSVALALSELNLFYEGVLRKTGTFPGNVLLAGFSQGGGLGLRFGLPRPNQFAGLASLSGSLRQPTDLDSTLPISRDQSLFIAHGKTDAIVPVIWSRQVADHLRQKQYSPVYKEYPMGHEISMELLSDLKDWIQHTLPPSGE